MCSYSFGTWNDNFALKKKCTQKILQLQHKMQTKWKPRCSDLEEWGVPSFSLYLKYSSFTEYSKIQIILSWVHLTEQEDTEKCAQWIPNIFLKKQGGVGKTMYLFWICTMADNPVFNLQKKKRIQQHFCCRETEQSSECSNLSRGSCHFLLLSPCFRVLHETCLRCEQYHG